MAAPHFWLIFKILYPLKVFIFALVRVVYLFWKEPDLRWYHFGDGLLAFFIFAGEMVVIPVEIVHFCRRLMLSRTSLAYAELKVPHHCNAAQVFRASSGKGPKAAWKGSLAWIKESWIPLIDLVFPRMSESSGDITIRESSNKRLRRKGWKEVCFANRVYAVYAKPDAWQGRTMRLGRSRTGRQIVIAGLGGTILLTAVIDDKVACSVPMVSVV